MDLFAGWFAVHVTSDDTRSALPHAPVQRDRRGPRLGTVRSRSATALRSLAERIDPYRECAVPQATTS